MKDTKSKPNGIVELKTEEERPKQPKTRRELIRELLEKVENGIKAAETKVTLADYIRLTQLERELEEEEQPREIIVTWSEPTQKRSVER